MDFIGLPPEVTSALIHSGPGAAPLVDAGDAWQRLGYDLEESIRAYSPVLASVAEAWTGPASTAMIHAVGTYLTWLGNTAQQCLTLGSSAQASAGAFGSVLAAVVHPSVVSANRAQLAQLLATNGLGKNVAAIAETEAQYERMWVSNAEAMYRYQTASAQALQLPMFTSPPSITAPDGPAAQAEAVQTAAARATSTKVSSVLANAAAAVAPADAVAPPVSPVDSLLQTIGVTFDPNQGWFGLANTYTNQFISSGFPINMLSYFAQNTSARALQSVAPDIAEGLSEGESALGTLSSATTALGAAEPAAAMGVAVSMGNLSAPPAATAVLTGAHLPVQLASAASPLPAGDAADGFPMLPPLMAPPISAGSGWKKRKEPKYEDLAMGLELKGTFMTRPPSAG
ncbi:MAG: PPE family protein [Mycobacteriaceae bacterium]|nr:PPE family protein [Mycobacteriaceae bacterium]